MGEETLEDLGEEGKDNIRKNFGTQGGKVWTDASGSG
jgi:hypothetical protein